MIIATALLVRIPTLAQPLVEAHGFRQTQTAYTALEYHRGGIDLLHTPLPVLGPPWEVPFEFPVFQAIGALVMGAGIAPDTALRLTSLLMFVVVITLVFAIVRLEVGSGPAWAAATIVAVIPLGFLWSRTATIETSALAASLGTVYAGLRWDRSGDRRILAIALGLAVLAGLIKITTAFIWIGPAVLFLSRSRLAALAIAGAAAGSGAAWAMYTDGIKLGASATAPLTSSITQRWAIGTLAERLDPTAWGSILLWSVGSLAIVTILAGPIAIRTRLGRWMMLTTTLGPVVLMHLYVVHDYYWMAVVPSAAILGALLLTRVSEISRPRLRFEALTALAAVFVLSVVAYPLWLLPFEPMVNQPDLIRAADIAARTNQSDVIAIRGEDWSPVILYYADRRGIMLWKPDLVPPPGAVVFDCPPENQSGLCVQP